jgi:hypothetical protein
MCTSHKLSNLTKHIFLCLLLVALVVLIGFQKGFALEGAPNQTRAKLYVLVDCDADNDLITKPFGDRIYMIDARDGQEKIIVRDLEVTDECGGFSVSEDGRFFIICDNELTFYEVRTGRILWFLMGAFRAATFSNDLVFATSPDSLYMIDQTGTIVKHTRMGVFDFAIDRSRNAFWMSGFQIKKYGLDLKPVLTVDGIKAMKGPFRIASNPDGSLWLSHQDAFKQDGNKNGLVKVSSDGRIMQTVSLNFSPQCVRVNPLNGNVWVTGRYRNFSKIGEEFPDTLDELNALAGTEDCTQKYDSEGGLLFHLHEGGDSLVIDPFDGSIWMANDKGIAHFSSTGEKLKGPTRIPYGRKWLALVPGRE